MTERSISTEDRSWIFMGTRLPQSEIVYFTQVIIFYAIIVTSIANLSLRTGLDELWTTLLCSSIGYLLPNPDINRQKKRNVSTFLPNPSQ